MMQAMAEIHSGPGVFHKTGEFPAANGHDFPLSKEAQRFFLGDGFGGSYVSRFRAVAHFATARKREMGVRQSEPDH